MLKNLIRFISMIIGIVAVLSYAWFYVSMMLLFLWFMLSVIHVFVNYPIMLESPFTLFVETLVLSILGFLSFVILGNISRKLNNLVR